MAKKTNKTKSGRSESISSRTRKLKQPNYQSFRLHKRIKHPAKIPSGLKLFRTSIKILINNWRLFGVLALLYGLLTIVLVRGFGGGLQLSELKTNLQGAFGGSFGNITTGLALFGYILGSAGSSQTDTGGLYQLALMIVFSLAIIWALRQINARQKIKARDAFYLGMYPLIPFVLILMVIGLQFLPLLMGSWVYGVVIGNGLAVTMPEKILWGSMFLTLATLSLYMVCSSVFALYIATLPNMRPMRALRSARQLVLNRRWAILRKILFLPLGLLVLALILMMPFILFATPLAEWVFFLMTTLVLVIIHSYLYTLYRELL